MREINAYLNFDGNCGEAMRFYQECLGGDLQVQTFADGDFEAPPGTEDRVMHARLSRGRLVLMASDTMPGMSYQQGNSVWLSVACESDAEVDSLHAALLDGGTNAMEPQDTFWNARFGMLTDRYGINWMFNHERAQQPA